MIGFRCLLVLSLCLISIAAASLDNPASVRWLQQFVSDPTAPYERPSVIHRELDKQDPSFKYTSHGDRLRMAKKHARYLALHYLRQERARLIVHALPPFILPSLMSKLPTTTKNSKNCSENDCGKTNIGEITRATNRFLSSAGPKLPLPNELHPVFVTEETHPELFTSTEEDETPSRFTSGFATMSYYPNHHASARGSSSLLATSPASLIAESRGVLARALTLPHSAAYLHDSKQFQSLAASVGLQLHDVDALILQHLERQWLQSEEASFEEQQLAQIRTRVFHKLREVPLDVNDDILPSAEVLLEKDEHLFPLLTRSDVRLLADVLHVSISGDRVSHSLNAGAKIDKSNEIPPRKSLQNRILHKSSSATSSPALLASIASLYPSEVTPECEKCRADYTNQAEEIKKLGPDYLKSIFLPFCEKYWPSLAPYASTVVCDPLIPGECEYLCRGMVHGWASSVADVLAIALSDPGYHCYYTQAVCPRDTTHDKPVFPTTLVRSAGKPKGSGKFKILHMSDIHMNEGYEEGERVDCKMPLCCRKENYTQFLEEDVTNAVLGGDEKRHETMLGAKSTEQKTFWSIISDFYDRFTLKLQKSFGFPVASSPMQGIDKASQVSDRDRIAARETSHRGLSATAGHRHSHAHAHSHAQLKSAKASSHNFGDTIANGARHFGEYTCDSPAALVESVMKEIPRHDVQHVVFTGDAPAHDLWAQTKQANLNVVLKVTNMTLAQLRPGIRYWPVLGNHAAAPVDQFGGPVQDAWINGPLAEHWGAFLGKDARVTLAWGGYYTAVMDAGVHVVALQTNFYDDANLFLKWGVGHWDMSGQLHWMESVLEQIQDLGEKAVILCHEKPRSFTRGVWAIKFQEILEKYSANIIAILAGHDHNDMTHVVHSRKSFMSTFRGDNEIVESILEQPWLKAKEKEVAMERAVHDGDIRTAEPILVEYLSSSVTPMARSTNPCYRVYTVDGPSLVIEDYDQYYLDLEKANKIGGAFWDKAYSAKSEYDLPNLAASSWHNFAIKMMQNTTYYKKYIQHFSAGYEHGFAKYNVSEAACSILTHLEDEMDVCFRTIALDKG